MDKVIVRTRKLSQALFSLAAAGCDTTEVSVVHQAIKVEGIRGDDERVTLHIWSKEAEDTEDMIGKGERLTEEEHGFFDKGKCPKCADHGQLYKGEKIGLAIEVTCKVGHIFMAPPLPWLPEYLGQPSAEVKVEDLPDLLAETHEEPPVVPEGALEIPEESEEGKETPKNKKEKK